MTGSPNARKCDSGRVWTKGTSGGEAGEQLGQHSTGRVSSRMGRSDWIRNVCTFHISIFIAMYMLMDHALLFK